MNLPYFPKLIARRRQENMGRSRGLHVPMSVLLLHWVFLQMLVASPLPNQLHQNHPEEKHMLDLSVSALQLILSISIFFCLSAPVSLSHFPLKICKLMNFKGEILACHSRLQVSLEETGHLTRCWA